MIWFFHAALALARLPRSSQASGGLSIWDGEVSQSGTANRSSTVYLCGTIFWSKANCVIASSALRFGSMPNGNGSPTTLALTVAALSHDVDSLPFKSLRYSALDLSNARVSSSAIQGISLSTEFFTTRPWLIG